MSLNTVTARRRSLVAAVGAASASAVLLAGCGAADLFAGNEFFSESSMGVKASPRVTTSRNVPKGGGRYQVGQPYTVAGIRFVPREQPDLNQTGRASWYGPAFHGRLTANGEIFDQYHLSGAHPTLPLPSYVRVTNLDNGATAIVRVNDRGPFSNERVIDLSRRTAEVLGYQQAGTANVRVQYVGPAPLEGDDTRFLVSSINQLTQWEINNSATRMAYQQTQVAATTPAAASTAPAAPARPTALDAANSASAVPQDIPFQILSYADPASLTVESEPNGTPVDMQIGSFADAGRANEIGSAFALLGAVETSTVTRGDQIFTHLMLRHLREGVTGNDVVDLATSLGLEAPISYE